MSKAFISYPRPFKKVAENPSPYFRLETVILAVSLAAPKRPLYSRKTKRKSWKKKTSLRTLFFFSQPVYDFMAKGKYIEEVACFLFISLFREMQSLHFDSTF